MHAQITSAAAPLQRALDRSWLSQRPRQAAPASSGHRQAAIPAAGVGNGRSLAVGGGGDGAVCRPQAVAASQSSPMARARLGAPLPCAAAHTLICRAQYTA